MDIGKTVAQKGVILAILLADVAQEAFLLNVLLVIQGCTYTAETILVCPVR